MLIGSSESGCVFRGLLHSELMLRIGLPSCARIGSTQTIVCCRI